MGGGVLAQPRSQHKTCESLDIFFFEGGGESSHNFRHWPAALAPPPRGAGQGRWGEGVLLWRPRAGQGPGRQEALPDVTERPVTAVTAAPPLTPRAARAPATAGERGPGAAPDTVWAAAAFLWQTQGPFGASPR